MSDPPAERAPGPGPSRPAGQPEPPRDLDSRTQIHDLVVHFYREIAFDPVLNPVFEEVAEVDWAVHMPRLTNYWCRVLLGEPGYDGMLLAAHEHVDRMEPFGAVLYDRWYELWVSSIDERWAGPNADTAKVHAAHVMRFLARRLSGLTWTATTS